MLEQQPYIIEIKKRNPSRFKPGPSIKPFEMFLPSSHPMMMAVTKSEIKLHVMRSTSLGRNYAWQGSTIYRRPSTPVHPRAAPRRKPNRNEDRERERERERECRRYISFQVH